MKTIFAGKRITALLLMIAMLFIMAVPVFAAEYDISGATSFVFTDSGITVSEGSYTGYKIDGTALTINGSGTYVVSGSCSDGSITVKKGTTDVVLVLNGLTLTSADTAPIACNKSTEVVIVAAAGTVNNLTDSAYNNDDTYPDNESAENAVIKCKDGSNVTICGTGTINVTANGKNGVKGGYDLYEEDEDGNATDTLLSTSSLTIKEVTLNITANVNDGLKSDKELNILSGTITVSAADDGIKCDYVMNIGSERTNGPTILVKKATEGIEAATLNIYSGDITVNATDDGINAANSDLSNYSFSYNQYGGSVYVNVTNGDGIDSNGTINLIGGTLEVYAPSQGDGDPLDSETGTNFKGATVLAVGHLGMAQGYSASTPYVTFGGTTGGFGNMSSNQSNLVTAGSTIQITDASGNVLYTAKAVRNASYVLFASPDLTSGSTYTLKNGSSVAATAAASVTGTGNAGMGDMGGNDPGQPSEGTQPGGPQGQAPDQRPGSMQPDESGNQPDKTSDQTAPDIPNTSNTPDTSDTVTGYTGFNDVDEDDWFYQAVKYVSENHLMAGTGVNFEPNTVTSRAMLVRILYRLAGEPEVSSANPFSDVADDQWYTDAVIWASDNDIVTGYGGGLFGPTDNITREQFVTILFLYAQLKGCDTSAAADISGYADASSVSSWAEAPMRWAIAEGLITGRSATTLAPSGNATRAEAATILMQFVEAEK
ncbi:MAG: carbohydrate-binding domain-containing protein [Clostridia bacterium]|nr:carbohydrate-binding domain-containing protein [Clostridia bacterium]